MLAIRSPGTLRAKTLLFFSLLMGVLLLVLAAIALYSFRQFSLYTAERQARSVAEAVKVSLTESMVNGTIDKRSQLLARMASVAGVEGVRVVRSGAVVRQFGAGHAQETASTPLERQVLAEGGTRFAISEDPTRPLFRAVLPFTASAQGTPNCLQCHKVDEGTVLGAITVEVPLQEVRQQAFLATGLVMVTVLAIVLFAWLLLNRLLRPLGKTTNELKEVVAEAVAGNFERRLMQRTSDEVGEIAGQLNRLMSFLDHEISIITRRVSEIMGAPVKCTGNRLANTTEMVEALVEAAKFKQAIEEDQHKGDVYRRLAGVLAERYDLRHFSIYEVNHAHNRIEPIYVDNAESSNCKWCDPQIMLNADNCRVRRTGHEIDAVDQPGLCTMFHAGEAGEWSHICLPMHQSGAVGCVVQLVVSKETAPLARLMVPFIALYLRETGPVLEAKRLMDNLRESALRDPMTGLYNRRFLEEYTATLVGTSQRRNSPFSVLMLDLDYFKQVNDTHGHEAGDKVIRTVADILKTQVRSSDLLVRYGGEEFLVVLVDSVGENAMKVAEKIRAKVEETKIPLTTTVLKKTISIGVAEFPGDADSFWQVVKYADVALYEAKSQGRNRVVRFRPEMWEGGERY